MKSWFLIVLSMFIGLTVNAQTPDLEKQDSQRKYEILFHEAMLQRQRGHHAATFDLLSRCLSVYMEGRVITNVWKKLKQRKKSESDSWKNILRKTKTWKMKNKIKKNQTMKKIFIALLATVLLALTSCIENTDKQTQNENTDSVVETVDTVWLNEADTIVILYDDVIEPDSVE